MGKIVYNVRIIEEINFNILANSEEEAEEYIKTHSIADITSITDAYSSYDDHEVIEAIYNDNIDEDDYAIDITNGKEEE